MLADSKIDPYTESAMEGMGACMVFFRSTQCTATSTVIHWQQAVRRIGHSLQEKASCLSNRPASVLFACLRISAVRTHMPLQQGMLQGHAGGLHGRMQSFVTWRLFCSSRKHL
jgi:hypothetical protein